jgi:hypothetical protein
MNASRTRRTAAPRSRCPPPKRNTFVQPLKASPSGKGPQTSETVFPRPMLPASKKPCWNMLCDEQTFCRCIGRRGDRWPSHEACAGSVERSAEAPAPL